jgi:thioesterase domain-containing protein/acyl carrier protein
MLRLNNKPSWFESNRDETLLRNLLVGELAKFLELPTADIDPAKSFDAYGLDSIDAVIATEAIGRTLGIELAPEILFINRSVNAMVEALLQSKDSEAQGGQEHKQIPIFLFPGGGLVDEPALIRFRAQCSPSLTFNVIRLGGWRDWIGRDVDFEELAKLAVQHIQTSGVEGAVQLAGFSQGGQLAHVVALALERAGHPVGCLVLLDSSMWGALPQASLKSTPMALLKGLIALLRPYISARLRGRKNVYPPGDARIRFVRWLWGFRRGRAERRTLLLLLAKLGRSLFYGPGGVMLDKFVRLRLFAELWGSWLVRNNPDQSRLQTQTFLFRSSEPDIPDYGWGTRCSNLTVVSTPGDHATMLDEDNLKVLVPRFMACIGGTTRTRATARSL